MNISALSPDRGFDASIQDASNTRQDGLSSKQTFMKLLVAQLRNQDPMNPMENTEMVSQLATISNVEHLESIRSILDSMGGGLKTVNSTFASNLIGRHVGLDSNIFSLQGSADDLLVDYRIPNTGSPVRLTLYDAAGLQLAESVRKGKAGELETLPLSKVFGRSLPDGSYRLLATNQDGEVIDSQIQAKVSSMLLPEFGTEPQLVLKSSTPVALSQVRTVR